MKVTGDARQLSSDTFPVKFGVIIADPPWPYENWSDRKQGAARAAYNLMTMDELYAMPVGNLAASDSVLLLWGTWPKVPESVKLMEAWGFTHVTGFPWIKLDKERNPVYGIGFWVRGCSEYVLIGRRGDVSPPRLEGFLGLMSPNLYHSRKPNDLHEYAESLPGPYLELFARRDRENWYCFGNSFEESQQIPLPIKQPTPKFTQRILDNGL